MVLPLILLGYYVFFPFIYSPNFVGPLSCPKQAVLGQLCHLEAGGGKGINDKLEKGEEVSLVLLVPGKHLSFLPFLSLESCRETISSLYVLPCLLLSFFLCELKIKRQHDWKSKASMLNV